MSKESLALDATYREDYTGAVAFLREMSPDELDIFTSSCKWLSANAEYVRQEKMRKS